MASTFLFSFRVCRAHREPNLFFHQIDTLLGRSPSLFLCLLRESDRLAPIENRFCTATTLRASRVLFQLYSARRIRPPAFLAVSSPIYAVEVYRYIKLWGGLLREMSSSAAEAAVTMLPGLHLQFTMDGSLLFPSRPPPPPSPSSFSSSTSSSFTPQRRRERSIHQFSALALPRVAMRISQCHNVA